ncbi:hypothetical protein [Streptomyces sp. NPDC050759]|uniref:hypothetical protein n=1 Tax=Streptomyces sp. NPDC050759 TaxID=3365635 RepID=UPI0037AC2DF7
MHIHDYPRASRPAAAPEYDALYRLWWLSGRLRARLLVLNLTAVAVPLLLALFLGSRLTAAVAGAFTVGMLVLVIGVLAIIATALWYDRACRGQCDRQADELRGRAAEFGSGTGGRR